MTASKRSIRSALAKVDRHRIKPREYDDAPELTDEQMAGAVVTKARPVGRPRSVAPKLAVKLRLDPEALRHFKSGGAGRQTRINDALVKVAPRAAKK